MKLKIIFNSFIILFTFCKVSGQKNLPLRNDLAILKPVDVFPLDAVKSYKFNDGNRDKQASVFKAEKSQNGISKFTSEIFSPTNSHYSIQSSWLNARPMKKGDVMLARLTVRSIYAKQESGEAVLYFYVQQATPPQDKSIVIELSVGPEWKTIDIPFKILNDMPEGKGSICLSYGALAQKVEISNIQVLNFQNKVALEKLPTTKFTYVGREATAEWRQKALKRIEEIRTAPLNVQVNDANGKPIPGANVNARLVSPEFIFGTAATVNYMYKKDAESNKYLDSLKYLFNAVTIDNNLKWPVWMNPEKRKQTDIAMQWIEENKLKLRGHNLVWPGKKFTPAYYSRQKDFGPGFADSIRKHIQELATYTKGKVYGWDVINEMLHETDYFKVMPRSQAIEWFKQAKSIDPAADLYINEYAMLNSVASTRNIEKYLALIAELRNGGAPIDAIGIQGHVGRQPRNPAQVITDLDLFTELGLPIQITEFDVNTPDDALQADYTKDFLIACYSHPLVTGFTMWGFWESAHWKPDAAMYRKDWTEKPNAAVWRNLVLKEWRTNINKITSSDGKILDRGHFGLYEISVTKDGKTVKVPYQLSKTSAPIEIKL
ncbi:endo-1,4-beta-xylanase [Pedobacter jamesrossensis]|uniref:Beta-xylanase n=1 Tax=Pedobacter jamesrossensis TaxID=1908238 RepID=A0ABV8NP88_9SPHI